MRAHGNPLKASQRLPFSEIDGRRKRRALLEPRVVPIYWDARFQSHPLDITVFDEFLRALFQSSWMSELAAPGVAPARLLPSFVPQSPPTSKLTQRGLEATVLDWVHRGLVTPGLGNREQDPFYVVLARFKPEPTGPSDSRCVAIPLLGVGPDLLEVHSVAVSRALAEGFAQRTAERRASASPGARVALAHTSTTRRSLPSRR